MNKPFEVTELKKVESSNISQIGFHDNVTFVEFKNGAVYSYAGTKKEDYESLVNAKSVGAHLNSEIKGKFEYEKVEYDLKLKSTEEVINNELKDK